MITIIARRTVVDDWSVFLMLFLLKFPFSNFQIFLLGPYVYSTDSGYHAVFVVSVLHLVDDTTPSPEKYLSESLMHTGWKSRGLSL